MPRDWDASTYDRLPVPMTGWGKSVVQRLDLRGDERVLDAGCGTGKVTAYLLERLPEGEVVALDGSPSMLEQARERLGEERVTYLRHDLLDPIPIDPVDAVLSTATFHWVPDHDRLFANLATVMTPGGQLEAQCGGAGNIQNVLDALAAIGEGAETGKVFATPAQTRARLERAGFSDVRCWLHEQPTRVEPEHLEPYLEAICLGGILEGRPPEERRRIAAEVADRMSSSTIEYVRLNISARRAR